VRSPPVANHLCYVYSHRVNKNPNTHTHVNNTLAPLAINVNNILATLAINVNSKREPMNAMNADDNIRYCYCKVYIYDMYLCRPTHYCHLLRLSVYLVALVPLVYLVNIGRFPGTNQTNSFAGDKDTT